MKNRILSIALALSLLAVVFAAVPTHADVYYTGSVKTTDDTGAAKETYVQGQLVYISAMVEYMGTLSDQDIRVRLETLGGGTVSQFTAVADLPAIGWYNSTETGGLTLGTGGAPITGDRSSFYVVLYERWSMTEIARTTVTILKVGLSLEPPSGIMGAYYPGQTVTAKLVTTYTTDMFYVHVTNDTGVDVSGLNWTAQIAPTGYWEKTFVISSTMPDGEYMLKVRDSTTHTLRYWLYFDVQMYYFDVQADRTYYLPEMTAVIDIMTVDLASFEVAETVTVKYWAHWYNYSANGSAVFESWENGTLDSSFGYMEWTIPADVVLYDDIEIMFWANESDIRSAEDWVWLYMGVLDADINVDGTWFVPGETVVVDVWAGIYWDSLEGADVDITVSYNGTAVDAYGASDLATDSDGWVTHTFSLLSSAGMGTYIVRAEVSEAGQTVVRDDVFEVEWYGWIGLTFDQEWYYGGDSAVVTIDAVWNGAPAELGEFAYYFSTDDGIQVWSNGTGDTIEFAIPDEYYGSLQAGVIATLSGYTMEGWAWADVRFADLLLSVNVDEYRPGDVVVWNWQVLGGAEVSHMEYVIWDGDGVKVAGEVLTYAPTGSFEFAVPTLNPSDEYGAWIWMTSTMGGFADYEVWVELVAMYELMIWPGDSGYTTGSFAPGDSVTVHYTIGAYLYNQLPTYELYVWTSYNPLGMRLMVTEPEGTFEVQVPDDAPTAEMYIEVDLYDPVSDDWLSGDYTAVTVNNELSGWDKSVGGMSAIDFTLLILIVIMIVLLIVVPFMKGRMGAPKREPAKSEPPQQIPPP